MNEAEIKSDGLGVAVDVNKQMGSDNQAKAGHCGTVIYCFKAGSRKIQTAESAQLQDKCINGCKHLAANPPSHFAYGSKHAASLVAEPFPLHEVALDLMGVAVNLTRIK
jgi:hypothetical protein